LLAEGIESAISSSHPISAAVAPTVPIRFELEAQIQDRLLQFTLSLELPEGFRELRIREESLYCDGKPVYTRQGPQVNLARAGRDAEAKFRIDWHLIALPILQEESQSSPVFVLKQWLARMLVLQPMPTRITGDSDIETWNPISTARSSERGSPASSPTLQPPIRRSTNSFIN